MKLRRIFLSAVLLLASASAAGAQGENRPPVAAAPSAPVAAAPSRPVLDRADLESWLDGYMPYALRRGDIPGATVAVVKDGQVLLLRGYGVSDVKTGAPVDPNTTLFRPGSISKLFVWTAVMQLVEQGKLDLDRDVNEYLDFQIPAPDGKPLTLRNIMTHRSGMEESVRGLIRTHGEGLPTTEEALKAWIPHRIFAPGTTPAYSNYATSLAGYIVQRVSGVPFDDYIERNVYAPIGMTKSTFRQPLPPALAPHMSKGYPRASAPAANYEYVGLASAGSMATTADDMARFMIAHLDEAGGALLQPDTKRAMHRTITRAFPGLNGMALGFYQEDVNGHKVVAHGGATRVFKSNLWLFIDDGVGIFVSLNAAGAGGSSGAVQTGLFEGFADRYFPSDAQSPKPLDAATARAHAQEIKGYYLPSRRADSSFLRFLNMLEQFEVKVDAQGRPVIAAAKTLGGAPMQLVEVEPYVWQDQLSKARMSAVVENGKVTQLGFNNSPYAVLVPAPWYLTRGLMFPLLLSAMGVLAIAALSWPAAAIARKRYGVPMKQQGQARTAYRLVRGLAWVSLATLLGWSVLLPSMLSKMGMINGGADGVVRLLQVGSVIGFVGFAAAAVWNAVLVWRDGRGWGSRVWSVVMLATGAVVLMIAFNYHLFAFSLNY